MKNAILILIICSINGVLLATILGLTVFVIRHMELSPLTQAVVLGIMSFISLFLLFKGGLAIWKKINK